MPDYLYHSPKGNQNVNSAVLVLPEIFGLNDFIKATTDRLATELACPAFALDHFYAVTGQNQIFDYSDHEAAFAPAQAMTAGQFLGLLTKALNEIQQQLPTIKALAVVGFCFGGKLSFLAGTDQRITKVASFYGSRPHDGLVPGGVVTALAKARTQDPHLKVFGFYGQRDASISPADRAQTKQLLTAAGISYQDKIYNAGHAFMNNERPDMYSEAASRQAWADVLRFLKQ